MSFQRDLPKSPARLRLTLDETSAATRIFHDGVRYRLERSAWPIWRSKTVEEAELFHEMENFRFAKDRHGRDRRLALSTVDDGLE